MSDQVQQGQSQATFEDIQMPEQETLYTISQYIKNIWDLGIITYGGPMSHIGIFKKRLITEMKCINEDKFLQLFTICQSVPGPTSTQLLTAISMYATGTFKGGLLGFLIFSLPAFVAMSIAVYFLQNLSNDFILKSILPGLRVVAVALIIQAFVSLFKKIVNSTLMIIIVLISAGIYYFYPFSEVIIGEFIISGILGYFYSKVPQTQENYNIPSRFTSAIFGIKNMIVFVIILGISLISLPYLSNKILIIFTEFYKIGSLVIGGGHVILPIMYSQFQRYKYFTEDEFYNGFSLISIMPGPMFNLCIYVGGIITRSFWGSLSAFIGLYLPCFLFILFILPYWQIYRKQEKIKKIISGICSTSIGLILTAAVMLYLQQLHTQSGNFIWFLVVTLIIILSYVLLQHNYPILVVFILGDITYILSQKLLIG